MDLTWLQSLVYGAVSGVTEILPVSAQAHRLLLRKLFGTQAVSSFTLLMIHIGILAAVYICCQNQIVRMTRALKLKRIPKNRRKRPLDTNTLMDFSLLRTMAIPVILAFLFMTKIMKIQDNIWIVSALLIVNGIILYIPQFFAGYNKDARTLSRLEGILIGLGAALSALPGISGLGGAYSVAAMCGAERKYAFHMALLLELLLLVCMIVMDVLAIIGEGLAGISFVMILQSILGAAIAFGATILTVKLLRKLAGELGFTMFANYCWGAALLCMALTMFA